MNILPLIIIAVIAIAVIIVIVRNIKIVPQAHAFVIERLGAYHQTWGTGLHIKVPFIDRISKMNGAWPGSAQAETIVNDYGETQFRCYVPEGATGVILSNGNGAQTEDIKDFGTYDGYWMDGSKNDLGHFIVTGWNY